VTNNTTGNCAATGDDIIHTAAGRIPEDIAFLIEERPLLWFESPREYDAILHSFFKELSPEGVLNCIFVKNVVDYAWEMRRMKKLKHTAINYVMPDVAANTLLADEGLWGHPDRKLVQGQAQDVAYGAEERSEEGKPSLAERMEETRTTPEMLHYKALERTAENLEWIRYEHELLENRFHRLLRDYEARNKTLVAMAKSLIEREKAEAVEFRDVN
jgi:hypothetical protein